MKEYLNILKKVGLFWGIEESEILTLLTCLSARTASYGKKQAVFLEGEAVSNVGIVLSGQLQIVKEDYYGNRSILAVLGEGELFGETFVCSGMKTSPISVFCVAESDVMFIDYKRLVTTCSGACSFHNRLILNMLRILADKNFLLSRKIEFTSKRTTREKLLAFLSAEAKKAGSARFEIPLNRQELADYLSVERSALSAELSKLRCDGVLDYHKSSFLLK